MRRDTCGSCARRCRPLVSPSWSRAWVQVWSVYGLRLGSSGTYLPEGSQPVSTCLRANDENKVLIAQAGAIAPLVTLVQSGTDDQKEIAAAALRTLAVNAENKVLIAQAGG